MEVSIPIDFINQQNIYFVEKKKNIIVEGDFVKVVYSTESFEMNGVFIAINFCTFSRGSYGPAPACVANNVCAADGVFQFTPSQCNVDVFCGEHLIPDNEQLDKSWTQIVNKISHNRENLDYSGNRKRTDDKDNENVKIDTSRGVKKLISFDSNSKENKTLIEKLCKFEQDIIKRYIDENCPKKTATYILKNQLMTNTIKYHSENKEIGKKLNNVERCILKVSGLWETATNVGITMKFTLLC
jgi:hypothetical protein